MDYFDTLATDLRFALHFADAEGDIMFVNNRTTILNSSATCCACGSTFPGDSARWSPQSPPTRSLLPGAGAEWPTSLRRQPAVGARSRRRPAGSNAYAGIEAAGVVDRDADDVIRGT